MEAMVDAVSADVKEVFAAGAGMSLIAYEGVTVPRYFIHRTLCVMPLTREAIRLPIRVAENFYIILKVLM